MIIGLMRPSTRALRTFCTTAVILRAPSGLPGGGEARALDLRPKKTVRLAEAATRKWTLVQPEIPIRRPVGAPSLSAAKKSFRAILPANS